MAETAWEKAFKEYKQQNKTSVANQKGTSGQTAWEKAFSAYKQYGSDGYHAIIQQRTLLDKERRQATNYANSFLNEANAFFKNADQDLTGSNQFNAAQFFDKRQKQAEALKQKAAELSQYMDDHMDSYTQESYDYMMQYLSSFNTDVDDVLSRYQPSLDSKAGMAAYEDEFIAAMERNAQLRQNQQAATFGVDPMYRNLGVFDSFFRQTTDNSKQAVTENWTAEQRYNLGHYQNEDPAKARKYAELVNAGKDPLTITAQQEAEKASMLAMDLESEKREIDQLKADLEDYSWNTDYDATSSRERIAFDSEIRRREREISDREQKYNLAKRAQESEQFRSAADRSGFDAKSGYVDRGFTMPAFAEDADPDELVYEYINNQNGVRSKVDGENITLASKGYDLLNEDEVALYNYYYATEGPVKAQQYLDNIQETLNYRMGERIAQSKSGDLWKQYLSAAVTGYSGAVSGLQNLFNEDEYIPASAFQQASGMIREELAEAGKLPEFYGDASLGQIGYDLISTTANMAPSIAAGSLFGPIAGAATMGASAAGNAYQQALNNGYTKEQARTYAALTGASEAGLEYVLGGISKLGGEIPQQIIKNMVNGVDNAVARAAITLGGSMVSEGFEEGLQEVITPWIENLTLYADKDVNWDEVAYSTLLGALSGGFIEGPGVIANAAGVAKVDKQLQNLGATEDISETPVQTPRVSTDGRAIQISTNEAIEALDFASLNKGKATVQLKNGETADYSDVSFASEAEANQFYSVASLPGIDTENANDLLHTIQDADAGKDVDSVVGIREAYGIGYFGMQESDLESGDAGKLTPELRKAVFDIGRQQRAADAMVKATAKPVTAKPSAGYKKVVFEGKTRKITKKQKAEIEFVDYIAENFSGNTVHVFESYKGNDGRYYYRDNNGKVHRAPNGKYVNGEIWLDLKSGDNQEGLVLNTFAHEMYHHIEKFDKAKAQELAEFVAKELGKKSVDDAVAEQIKKARKAGLGESYFERQGMTKEQARNEVYMRAMSDFVADSLETMFTRGDPAKAIANLKQENRTLFDEIKAFIDKWVSKLKEFYSDKTISKEGELVAQLEKFEQLQQLFMEGVQSAGENYRAALSELTPGEAGEIVNDNGELAAASTKDQGVQADRDLEETKNSERRYSYETITNKPDMAVTLVGDNVPNNRADVVAQAKKNAATVGKFNPKDGSVSVRVKDIGKDVVLGTAGLKHGLDRRMDSNAAVTLMAGEILQNSIQINEMTPQKAEADGSYILIGAARNSDGELYIVRSVINSFSNELASMDVLYAINAKKGNRLRSMRPGFQGPVTDSTISIADLLEYVNEYFPDILPEDVLKHFGHEARPDGKLGESALYSLRNEKTGRKESGKSYKAEQKDIIQQMQTEQRLIREELTGKKSDISIMEKEFIRLAKQYERLDTKTGKKSAKDARAITQLRTALKEEAKSHREDSKIWEREFNRLLRDYDTAGRQIDRLEATIARQRATAKARVEGRRNTEMRHKIQRKVNELDQLLRHGSKHRNVPEFLQSSVAEVLNAINMEVRDGDQRRKTYEANLARYDRQIAAATDPATVSRLIEKRNEYAAKGDQFANRMDTLKKAYDQIRKENTGLELDEGIAEHLSSLFETVGDTPLGQMTAEQLEAVNDILNVTMTTVRNANQMLAEARTAGVVETSKSAITEIKSAGETKKKKTRFRKGLEQFGWNNLKPEYAIEVIGSKTLKARYDALRKGEDTLAVDLNEAKKFVQEQWKKNGGKDWDMDQKFTFTSTSGKSFELNLDQIMNLYALAKDKDAQSHLRVGGFAFDNNYQTEENINLGPVKIPVKMESTDASAYNLSDEILGEIISKLSPEQRAFADAMQAYLSDTMAAKGNEVSLKKYGIRLFKKKDYFPIRVADQFMAKAREQQAGDRKLKDAGFTKDRKPEAKNPVVISGFMKTWAEHVDEMSLYHSFVLPLDDFNRVLNYHDAFVEGEQAHSVVEAITNAFGEGAVKYLDQMIKDVNGGIKGGSTVSFANRMMSKAKKAQTMASLSVAIQQPSSILRSMSEVDLKYFLGPKVTEKTHDRTWEEIKAHAPIAIIKEMGGYDTNVGKSTVDYLTDTEEYNGFGEKFKAMFTDEKFRDDALGRLPALMDEMSWGVIWNAVKREQADQHPNMDAKSDAFKKLVAKRFTEVITRTQVYDSVFSRSGLMRDRKSDLAKMTTSFMAEPTTTANMLAVSILQAKRGDIPKKQAVKTTASIVASLALNAALVSVVYAMRDDDEDKRYDEKWIENFYSNFFESLNPIGYIPYVRDIYNLFVKGYDVERADMELYGDLQNAIDGLDNDDLTAWEKTENVIGAIGNLVGVPLKNILRDSRGVAKTIAIALDEESKDRSTKTGKYMARRGMDLSDGEEMILALQRGDEEHIQRVFGRFETQQKAESALQSAIGEQYKNDKLTAEEAEELLNTAFVREDEHEVYWIMDKWNYAIENGNSEGYTQYGKLYEAIENGGDYTAEMDRLTEHGSEASEIRSQVTKKYHKQYLEGDEATRKEIKDEILPVYEAAGLDAEEIGNKFRDWDFEAEFGMTYSEMKAEYRNGDVTQNEMRNAMKFYGLKNFEIEENMRSLNEEIKFVNKYDMTLAEMQESYDDGNVTRNQMTNALVFSGMTQTEAREWVDERDIENRLGIDYAKLDDAYKHGDISRTTLRNAIIEHGETPEKADETMMGYDWLKKNVKKYPDMSISDAKKFAVRISTNAPDYTLEDFGVKVDDYIQYSKLRPDCKGVDNNGDGQADSGTKRDAIFKMIDSLPISSDAKDGLALIDYGMKSILKNAPWH